MKKKPQQSENCFECQGRGHKAFECLTKIKREQHESGNKKGMHATLNDNEENSDTQQESHNYVAFATYVSSE